VLTEDQVVNAVCDHLASVQVYLVKPDLAAEVLSGS
jgi:hypothetical protein